MGHFPRPVILDVSQPLQVSLYTRVVKHLSLKTLQPSAQPARRHVSLAVDKVPLAAWVEYDRGCLHKRAIHETVVLLCLRPAVLK